MPRIEPKVVQKELESGTIHPLYWLFGSEDLKSRELVKRIHTALTQLGPKKKNKTLDEGLARFEKTVVDAGELTVSEFVDHLRSPGLGTRFQLFTVRNAHVWKDLDLLIEWAAQESKLPPDERGAVSIAVLLAKELDIKKKAQKAIAEACPCVPCEEVAERDRLAWIRYLAERRELKLPQSIEAALLYAEPWSLDRVEQELERLSLTPTENWKESFGDSETALSTPVFVDAFFKRSRTRMLSILPGWAASSEDYFPLLGLLSWYARQMDTALRGGSPAGRDRIRDYVPHWDDRELGELHQSLQELDLKLKSAPIDPMAAWTSLAMKFCRN